MWIKKFVKNANYKNFFDKLKEISKENNRSYFLLVVDYGFSLMRYGFVFNDYLNYKIYDKKRKERKEYASVRDQDKFYEKVSPSAYKISFSDKSKFMNIFKDYVKRDFITKYNTFDEFKTFIKKHQEIIVKPVDGLGGGGVSLIKTKSINPEIFYKEMVVKNYLLEEVIIQHPELSEFSPTSVNTLRIMTSNVNNNPKILFSCLRVGNGKNHVDNFHQGGMASLVHKDTGTVISEAINKNLKTFITHPVSKKKFLNFQIPFYKETINLVLDASKVVPEIMVVGWDIAITPTGPVIVEGNRRAGFDIVQVLSQKGRKDIMQEVYSDMKKK